MCDADLLFPPSSEFLARRVAARNFALDCLEVRGSGLIPIERRFFEGFCSSVESHHLALDFCQSIQARNNLVPNARTQSFSVSIYYFLL